MIDPEAFVKFIDENYQFICGVPCSYFKEMLIYLETYESKNELDHFLATREDEAIALASGVALSGKPALVYMQNSGLGNIGDALTSLAQLYKLPMLILVSYRGLEPDKDFPEHSVMGDVTESLLEAMKIPYSELTVDNWEVDMKNAMKKTVEASSPVVLLVRLGVLNQ
ncbi:MAG: thiamine pyrophosphate-binding protein [Candidatus Heimdallarchaeota archaeon]|nr:hypothetical protein [Candidatus Heimdallarchaeota archaeon]MCG3252665.1 hypothetical protein [Candidatus Heimdallarchaeota archaeon]MCK4289803.1 hypothetical protein [Candidatus Heimdallarchaeota archaeon]